MTQSPIAPNPQVDAALEELKAGCSELRAVGEVTKETLLEQAIATITRLSARAQHAEEERRRCLEASRSLRGSVRVMARLRPRLANEMYEDDEGLCLRVLSRTQ